MKEKEMAALDPITLHFGPRPALKESKEPPLIDQPLVYIGEYPVHPVANLFPLIEGDRYDQLKVSIEDKGQQLPIIVKDGMIVDGRNRMRACLELDIEPIIEEYSSSIHVVEFILITNTQRRDLTEDQRSSIISKAVKFKVADRNRQRMLEAGKHGVEGGRGHKKTPRTNSSEGFTKTKKQQREERETRAEIAKLAHTSEYKAGQAMKIDEESPELADCVARGELSLTQAVKMLPEKPKKPKPFDPAKAITRALKWLQHFRYSIPDENLDTFARLLAREISKEIKSWQ